MPLRPTRLLPALLLPTLLSALALVARADDPPRFAIRASKVLTMADQAGGQVADGLVAIRGGKIVAVTGFGGELPAGTRVLELDGYDDAWLTPGLIELHCHVGGGAGFGDLNDMVHQVNGELRNLDVVMPGNALIRRGLQGGVTTALFIPGSGTNLSGFGTLIKFRPSAEGKGAVLRFPGALKIAQALNPERGTDFGAGRMGMNAMIRTALEEGRDHARARKAGQAKPGDVPRLDYMAGLFEGKTPIIVHTASMQVQHATTRILHDEFGLRPILSHGTFDGYLDAPFVAKRGLHVNLGPRQVHIDRRARAIHGVAERWWHGGVRNMSVCTDSPVLEQEDLFYQGTLAGYFSGGGGPTTAALLYGLTRGSARALFIEDRIGSLEPGKDADLVLWSGDPLDPRTRVLAVWIDGERVYDLRRDRGRY